MFGEFPFERWSEQDVRECVIRPLLEKLGYTPDMVTTQLPLKYCHLFLGHKKGPSKDRPLRGEADYILDVDGRLRWVVEAKKPGAITDDDREQAYSYAMHPQVRAIIFAVITGTHFEVFHTFDNPERGPILSFEYRELRDSFQRLSNLVSPDALRLFHPSFVIDVGRPLGSGLRSFAKIENGKLTYTDFPESLQHMKGLVVHFSEGSIVRNEDGGITALIRPSFHDIALTEFSKAIAATELEFITADEVLSRDALKPTVFSYERDLSVKEGTPVPVLGVFNTNVPAPVSVTSGARVDVTGYLDGKNFRGKLVVYSQSYAATPPVPFSIRGDIELRLS